VKDKHAIGIVFEHKPVANVKGKDISFKNRTLFHKLARVVYLMIRSLYVTFIFYLNPLVILFFLNFLPLKKH
jgi:hypothetical protein